MTKQKALCVATRCTTAEQFIETFHRFCDEQSFFVATMNMRPVGLETPFSIQLADKTPVLRGLCVVLAAYTTSSNPYKRPGIRLGIRKLTPETETIFYQLQAMRTAAPQEIATEASEAVSETPVPIALPTVRTAPKVSPPPTPKRTVTPRAITVPPKATPPEPTQVVAPPAPPIEDQRTPGSELVLPANPLQNLTDESLEGYVDCTLYEETGNFFRAPEDDRDRDEPAAPPKPVRIEVDDATFNPSIVIAEAFPDEPTNEPTIEKRVATATEPTIEKRVATVTTETPSPFRQHTSRADPPPPIPASPFPPMTASRPVALPLPAVVEEAPVARTTPVPAGEAFSRPASAKPARSKWLFVGGGAVAAILAVVVVFATRSDADDDNEASPVAAKHEVPKPVEQSEPPKPEPPKPDEIVQEPTVDGDEAEAVAADPSAPLVGDGPCKVDITTTPAGTMVKLDDKMIGPSPITIAGTCGRHKVDLVHPRYKAEQRWVTMTEEKAGALDVTLVRPTHTLTITTTPPGATVSIGGRRAGTSPTKLQVMGFSNLEVKIEKNGFETVAKRIYSKLPEDTLSVPLKRALWIDGAVKKK